MISVSVMAVSGAAVALGGDAGRSVVACLGSREAACSIGRFRMKRM